MARLVTRSAEETEAAGAALAALLAAGDVVLIGGELGTGKTTFVRGACRALGVADPVTSPTFTVGQVYLAGAHAGPTAGAGPLEIAHLDLYRLSSLAGEDPALLEDYLTPERISFVEWPALAEPDLEALGPGVRVAAEVRIDHGAGESERAVDVSTPATA